MTSVVLDASALLALLLGESGAGLVQSALPGAAMSMVNSSEVVAHFARSGASEIDIQRTLAPLQIELAPFDEEAAFLSGMLVPLTRSAGLSLGDRACLALARHREVPAVTADRNWGRIAESVGVNLQSIR